MGVAGDLAQAHEAFEDVHAGAVHPVAVDFGEDLHPVAVPPLVVDFFLFRLHLAMEDLLVARRQFRGDLLLLAAQDEGVDQPAQRPRHGLVLIFLDRRAETAPEIVQVAQQAGIEKGELRPEFDGVVLHRGAGEHEAVAGLEQPRGAGGVRERILDLLRFVEHDVMKRHRLEEIDVAQQGAIGGQDQIRVGEILGRTAAVEAEMGLHLERRRKAGRLLLPVEDQRGGADHQAGRCDAALLFPQQQRQSLHRLAQSHIIRQTAAEAELLQKAEPVIARFLITAQLALQPLRHLLGLDFVEGLQLLPQLAELVILDKLLGFSGEQLHQCDVGPGDPGIPGRELAQVVQVLQLFHPLLRQAGKAFVGELDNRAVLVDRRGQLFLTQGDAVKTELE